MTTWMVLNDSLKIFHLRHTNSKMFPPKLRSGSRSDWYLLQLRARWRLRKIVLQKRRHFEIWRYQSKTSSGFRRQTKSTPLCAKFLFLRFSKLDGSDMTVKVNAFCEQMAMMLQQRCELHGTNLAECPAFSSLSWIFLQRSP